MVFQETILNGDRNHSLRFGSELHRASLLRLTDGRCSYVWNRRRTSTQPFVQLIPGRVKPDQMLGGEAFGGYRLVVVGPFVDISAKPDASPRAPRLATSKRAADFFELCLPYYGPATSRGIRFRMVTLDKSTGRWLDVEDQFENASKKLISARVSKVGRFTMVAEVPPTVN